MENRLSSRPATKADIMQYYPDVTTSFRAWVCEMDGESIGMIGVAMGRPFACMFSSFKEPLRPHLKSMTVMKLIKKAHAVVKQSRVPVRAIAEPSEPTAPHILERLGFEHIGEADGDQIYEYWGG